MDNILAFMSSHAAAWRGYVTIHPMIALTAFIMVYAGAVVAFLPVALILTALGGYLFGVVGGTVASVVGATLGGVISYSAARGVFAPWVHRRFDTRPGPVQRLLRGVKSGAFGYLLTLRLLPMTPFGLISMASGAGRMPLAPYLAATALGIVPECSIYAAVGWGLRAIINRGGVVHRADLMRPGTVFPLVGLAILCLATISLRRRWRRKPA